MFDMFDFAGLAVLVGALGIIFMQWMNFKRTDRLEAAKLLRELAREKLAEERQTALEKANTDHDEKLVVVKGLVNGQSEKLEEATRMLAESMAETARLRGQKEGRKEERERVEVEAAADAGGNGNHTPVIVEEIAPDAVASVVAGITPAVAKEAVKAATEEAEEAG